MNRYKMKENERHWFSANDLMLQAVINRCKQEEPGSFCYKNDIERIKSKIQLYGGISVHRVKTFQSKLLRVMYE